MQQLVDDIAASVKSIDESKVPFKSSRPPFKEYRPGAGPYGEPQLAKLIVKHLAESGRYPGIVTKRAPDVLVPKMWALEFKIVRPFGDDGNEAEHWSQNLLHPYTGNVSAIGDALKLMTYAGEERRAIILIAYEHEPPKIDLEVLISGYELLCRSLLKLPLGDRHTCSVSECVHPVHQRATVYGWELAAL
ncbi:MAG: hypothetical protein M3O30_03105 [Planctomycetota bacterium]|nr:hypothetical protein [Planctomycetota bacterium]